jgi:electron transfer flavoprotein beta subunit
MLVAVVLRLVPDLSGEFEIADDGKDIDREWIGMRLNEFDDHALEEAILLKEAEGATVIALALAGEGVDRMLQSAIARGADRAVKISHSAEVGLSSRAAAPVIAAAVRQLGVELVLTGVQTPEDLFGQLAPYLGATLDWPHVSAVGGVQRSGDGIEVLQEYSGGISATLRLGLPAVIGVQTASQPPRYVSGSKLRQAMSEPIAVIESDAMPTADMAEILALREPTRSVEAVMLDGDAETVADKLHSLLAGRSLVKG